MYQFDEFKIACNKKIILWPLKNKKKNYIRVYIIWFRSARIEGSFVVFWFTFILLKGEFLFNKNENVQKDNEEIKFLTKWGEENFNLIIKKVFI